jgi:lysozyme
MGKRKSKKAWMDSATHDRNKGETMISILLPLLLAPVTQSDPQLVRCADVLKHHEGLSLVEYIDTTGHKTIGYGHKLDMGESIPHITAKGAEALLKFDVGRARDSARKVYSPTYDTLPQNAQDALLYMAYQLGETGLRKFKKLKQAILVSDWRIAGNECLASKWAQQTPVRARFCASLFLSCLPSKTIQQGIKP